MVGFANEGQRIWWKNDGGHWHTTAIMTWLPWHLKLRFVLGK